MPHPITKLPRALAEAGYEQTTYRRVYVASLDGTIPTTQSKTGRWTFSLDDLPAIAEGLGLTDAHAA